MESGLLDIACARIAELIVPAFIKDSQLRYVAVNDAYARFHGAPACNFAGKSSDTFSCPADTEPREDRERRSLVFGTEEAAFLTGADGSRHRIDIERFITEDDHFYIFGIMEEAVGTASGPPTEDSMMVSPAGDGASVPAAASLQGAGQAFDLAGIGIALFDAETRLVYENITQQQFYGEVMRGIGIGDTLVTMLERLWDAGVLSEEKAEDREAWLRNRLDNHRKKEWSHVDCLPDGRYVRVVSRRVDNDALLIVTSDVSEGQRQDTLLRHHVRATEIYRSALEALPVAVFMRDRDGRMTYANAAYEKLLGDDHRKFLGKDEREMFPNAWEQFRAENSKVILSGEVIEKSEDVVFDGDRAVPIITRLSRVEAPGGESLVLGSITDVSLLKAREVQLLEARGHAEKLRGDLETILQSVPMGVMILNEHFTIDYVNAAFGTVWTVGEPESLIGKPYRDFVRINFDLGAYAGIGDDFDTVYRARIDSFVGEEEPLEVHSPEGKVLIIGNKVLSNGKYLLTYFDITAVRHREEEAREAQAALERLGALMRDATGVMSQGLLILREGIIQMSNDALVSMMRVPAAMLAPGCSWRAIFAYMAERGDFGSPEEAAVVLADWEGRIGRGESISASLRADGRVWVQIEINLSGQDHWLAVFTDVTEMKQREEELTRLLERAEAADRAKSEFLANMSHEIRTPMNGVLGMAELLAKSELDTRQKTFTDIIVKSGNALLTIINDILDFSKIDAGQMKLRSMPFDPVEAVEDVASLLSTSAAQKDIEIVVRGATGTRHVVIGDAGRFRQIVTNLVGNAVKFTEKGHVLIDIGFRSIADGRQMLTLRIADSGIGIPEDMLQTIFDKFSQADASNTRRHEGTGLGLSITAGLVGLFGGKVSVESVKGQGSVFTVHLPFSVAGARQQPRSLPANVLGAHVLVIDDNGMNRSILTEELCGWGFDACACESGEEAIAIFELARQAGMAIDAVLIDFPMAGDNAEDIAARMRDDPRYADIPVIFLTSMDATGNESLFATLNVQAHLMKPPRIDLLRATVTDVVRNARLKRSGEDGSHGDDRARAPAQAPQGASVRPETHGLDVLVAEDNEVNQIVFTQILQSLNLSFRIACNGQEAVEAWRTDAPSIILMDVSMPVMNGHQATRLIRSIEAEDGTGQRVPIIGVTAHALERDHDLCLESGMDDYLSKPISPELLEAKLGRWFTVPPGEAATDGGNRSENLL